MLQDSVLGYCGLCCESCKMYQTTKSGHPLHAEDGTPLLCDGCQGSRNAGWCAVCTIKSCCREKGFENCLSCPDNPCEQLSSFIHDAKYPYHLGTQESMRMLRDSGLEAWKAEWRRKTTCPSCSAPFGWLENACPSCGVRVSPPTTW